MEGISTTVMHGKSPIIEAQPLSGTCKPSRRECPSCAPPHAKATSSRQGICILLGAVLVVAGVPLLILPGPGVLLIAGGIMLIRQNIKKLLRDKPDS